MPMSQLSRDHGLDDRRGFVRLLAVPPRASRT